MRFPERYLQLDLAHEPYRLDVDETGKPLVWENRYGFEPHGFLPTQLFALGNGDSCGFYWPIGREDSEPILGEVYHDRWVIVPIASSLEGLVRIKALMGSRDDEGADREIAERLGITLPEQQGAFAPAAQCLEQDQNAPASLATVGKIALDQGDTTAAERYLQQAIEILPEFTTAHYYLASLYRRDHNQQLRAAQAMIDAVTSPLVFLTDGDRKQVLHWLQQLMVEDDPDLTADPIWSNRQKLSFERGVKRNDDFAIYEEAITEYLDRGQGVKAIRLRVLVGRYR